MATTQYQPLMHEQFNEYEWEQGNRNSVVDPQSYMSLQLGHHNVWITMEAAEGIWDIVKNIELTEYSMVSIPVRGQVHVITDDQLPRLKTKLEGIFGA